MTSSLARSLARLFRFRHQWITHSASTRNAELSRLDGTGGMDGCGCIYIPAAWWASVWAWAWAATAAASLSLTTTSSTLALAAAVDARRQSASLWASAVSRDAAAALAN